jgi:hypothetical protein
MNGDGEIVSRLYFAAVSLYSYQMGCHNLWVGRTGHGKAETRPKEKPQSQVGEYITKLMRTANSERYLFFCNLFL